MGRMVKRGDEVKVMRGRERGKTGKVLRVLPESDRIVIEGLNMVKRHMAPNQQNKQGGIVEKEAPIHQSNVVVTSSGSGKAK